MVRAVLNEPPLPFCRVPRRDVHDCDAPRQADADTDSNPHDSVGALVVGGDRDLDDDADDDVSSSRIGDGATRFGGDGAAGSHRHYTAGGGGDASSVAVRGGNVSASGANISATGDDDANLLHWTASAHVLFLHACPVGDVMFTVGSR